MAIELPALVELLGLNRVVRLSGVSGSTIRGLLEGRVALGPRVRVRLEGLSQQTKVNLLRSAGASKESALSASRLSFGQVQQLAQRMEDTIANLVRDNNYPGSGFSDRQLERSIRDAMGKSVKTVREIVDAYA